MRSSNGRYDRLLSYTSCSMKYLIQWKIETLAENAVGVEADQPSFIAGGIAFTHWEFNRRDGWSADAWQAEAEIEAPDYKLAFKEFGKLLTPVIPRISFVSQAYTEARMQPVLIRREGSGIGVFLDYFDSGPVGLMFMDKEKDALDKLLTNTGIDDAFFNYWNDAVNTAGHTAKLLVMLSAIEALAKKPNGKKDWSKIINILGQELKGEIFTPSTGLRHRLIHGEYFGTQDSKNYVNVIHKRVMKYFNDYIFDAKLLSEDVTGPQRHFFGNKMKGTRFIKPINDTVLFDLRTVVADINQDKEHIEFQFFEWVVDDRQTTNF